MTISPSLADVPTEPNNAYPIDCHACGATYDALQAPWCQCIVKERSVLCTLCGQCFCRADLDYKRNIWTAAPEALWERKQRNAREQAVLPENPPQEAIARPLILVVDDDREIRALAVHLVKGWGYGCIHAANGTDGLALARAYRPDLILTDALMPRMDGRELCRLVKSDPEIGATRVVIMSSVYTSGRFKREALSHFKADDYLAKPVDAVQLQRLVRASQRDDIETPIVPEPEAWVPPHPPINSIQTLLLPDSSSDAMSAVAAMETPAPYEEAPQLIEVESALESEAVPPPAEDSETRLRLTARELIRLSALGLDSEVARTAKAIPGLRAVDLIAIRTAAVPLEFVQAIEAEVLETLASSELITLFASGCDAEAINQLRRLELDATAIIALISAGISPSFVQDVVAVAERPLTATELMRLHAAGVDVDYIRALGSESLTVDDWIRFWTLGVSPDFFHAAAEALTETCSTEELLQMWLLGVDVPLLRQLRGGI
jgi:CheY-like chemotaxis protein